MLWKRIVLWLFVINLGVAFGAGVYESRVVVSRWADIPPDQWPNTGLLFWAYVTTVPLTLLTILNAIAAYRSRNPQRRWHLSATAVVIVERLATFSYFIPTMIGLMGSQGLSEAEIRASLTQWELLNYVRHLLTLTGWILALKALTKFE